MNTRSVLVIMIAAGFGSAVMAQQPGTPVRPATEQPATRGPGVVGKPVEAAPEKEEAVQTPAPPGQTPEPSVRTPRLPGQYKPMALPPKFSTIFIVSVPAVMGASVL